MNTKLNAFVVVFITNPQTLSSNAMHPQVLAISKSFKCLQLSCCAWAFTHLIVTSDSIGDLKRKFFADNAQLFGPDDRLFVLPLSKPFDGIGTTNLRQWMQENVPDDEDGNTWEDRLN